MSEHAKDISFIVVEDNAFQRNIAVKILEAMGSSLVLSAEDGQEAIEHLIRHDHKIDIAITDLDMPGMDGVEFMRHVAEQKLCHAIAVASGMDDALIHTVEDLVDQHGLLVLQRINKPLNEQKVCHLLDEYRAQKKLTTNAGQTQHLLDVEEIKVALEEHQFVVWYQPKVNMQDGSWNAVEALSRWMHPQKGIINPACFIPVLEQQQWIDQLTWQQIHHISEDLQYWKKKNIDMSVSINVSPSMLNDMNLIEKLMEVIRHYKIKPNNIILEITESVVIQNLKVTLETIARLKLKGFLLSIDDFGTGFSSLQQLSRIPFSELKIDQSFVSHAHENNTYKAIVEANIDLANKLHLKTVAEGISSQEAWNLLCDLGCHMAQGFLVSEAMPKECLESWYTTWSNTTYPQLSSEPLKT